MDWAVRASNAHVFHVRETLVPVNGSGDTSYAWAQLWLLLSLAAIGCVVWTLLDRKRAHYERPAYWLRLMRAVLHRGRRAQLRHHQAVRAPDVLPDHEPARHATRRFPADALLVDVHRLLDAL